MFSLGVLVLSRRRSYTPDLFSFVFGDILGVSRADVLTSLVLGAAVLLFVLALYRELVFVAYDPAMASASGLPVVALQYALLVLIAVAVVVSLRAIGIVLVNAMLIIPAATASVLVQRLPLIMALGAALGLGAAVTGLQLSYHYELAASPAIVLVSCALFAAALALRSVRERRRPRELVST
jgi:manganese/iron transport system permease protein